ncbi:unnamed protein product [Arctia plantaginis]|uniref:Regulatory protein zeste n=1 Tax=Arctia plantaginis TaxID=874455 RepID=A0A8S0ZFF7_ARCPL|nr:unnamed protein product [Arctia plantaginis]
MKNIGDDEYGHSGESQDRWYIPKKKTEAWEDIAYHYNNSPNVSQRANAAQLKKMWQNLKTKARDAKTLEAQKKWTGGGPAPPAIGSEETQVKQMMMTVFTGKTKKIE